MLQSRTTIHVATIPNHEAMISFWGETRGQPICNCYSQLVRLKLKIFVDTLMLPLSPIDEDPNNPSTRTKQERYMSYKDFYYDLYNAKPIRSTDRVVKEKLVKEKML